MADQTGMPEEVPIKLRCTDPEHYKNQMMTEDNPTFTSNEQIDVEMDVSKIYKNFCKLVSEDIKENLPYLDREKHAKFLRRGIRHLSSNYECLDSSQTWLLYWMLHSMELLGICIPDDIAKDVVKHLSSCQDAEGGFGGGPYQQPHLAPTYGAICSLCIVGTPDALRVINREKLYSWLMSMKKPDGSFAMHKGGEVDVRGVYCAVVAAKLTNIITKDLFAGTPEWVVSCQTYEGGFGGAPGLEAHGGYTYCAIAALSILDKQKECNMNALLRWVTNRQMRFEGGFQGRTNKLVDSCYSFWQGGIFPLLHRALALDSDAALSCETWMFDEIALQEYVLICCQSIHGGLFDKPGKAVDYYHTCYSLSGLSVAQHFDFGKLHHRRIAGSHENELHRTHPAFNIGHEAIEKAANYFKKSIEYNM